VSDALTISLPPELVEQIARRAADLLAEQHRAPEPWLDVTDAAKHLGYGDNVERGKRRVYDLVSRRELEPRRDGKRLLFRPADLDAYLEEHA